MAYTEQFPLDVTPQGDSVRGSIEKNRNEILSLAKQMDDKNTGGGSGGLRNRILSAAMSNDQFNYLTVDNLTVSIDGSITPIIASFANGFDQNGMVDYIETITNKMNAFVLTPNATNYLFIERSKTGDVNYGTVVDIEPEYSTTRPSDGQTDKSYYNPNTGFMYVFNGFEWKKTQRIYIAKVVTNSTNVTILTYLNHDDSTIATNMIASGAITTDKLANQSVTKDKLGKDVTEVIDAVLDKVYPVGSIYCSIVGTNPKTLFGFGNWEYIEQGRVLLSQGSDYKAGAIGGETTHKLTVNELPSHNHTGTTANSGNHNHSTNNTGAHKHFIMANVDKDGWGSAVNNGNHLIRNNRGLSYESYDLRGASDESNAGLTNSSGNHTHTISNNGNHTHTFTTNNTGGNAAHNIMQPYLSVYMWKRVS